MIRGVLKSPIAVICVAATAAFALALSFAQPPAFWLVGIGVALIVITAVVNGRRTGIWFHTPWESEDREFLPPLESGLGTAGILLMAIPLAVAALRIMLGP
jgi:hypothetical protein